MKIQKPQKMIQDYFGNAQYFAAILLLIKPSTLSFNFCSLKPCIEALHYREYPKSCIPADVCEARTATKEPSVRISGKHQGFLRVCHSLRYLHIILSSPPCRSHVRLGNGRSHRCSQQDNLLCRLIALPCNFSYTPRIAWNA